MLRQTNKKQICKNH